MQYWVKLFKFLDAGEIGRAKEMRLKLKYLLYNITQTNILL